MEKITKLNHWVDLFDCLATMGCNALWASINFMCLANFFLLSFAFANTKQVSDEHKTSNEKRTWTMWSCLIRTLPRSEIDGLDNCYYDYFWLPAHVLCDRSKNMKKKNRQCLVHILSIFRNDLHNSPVDQRARRRWWQREQVEIYFSCCPLLSKWNETFGHCSA